MTDEHRDEKADEKNANDDETQPRWKRWLRRLGIAMGVLLIVLLVAVGLTQTDWGEEKVGAIVTSLVSDAIAGSMAVEDVEDIGYASIHVRGLSFADPNGDNIIEVGEALVAVSLSRLFKGEVYFTEAWAKDGELIIAPGAENSTTLEDAFASSGGGGNSEPGEGMNVTFPRMDIEDMALRVMMGPGVSMSISDAALSLNVDRQRELEGGRPTEVEILHGKANFFMADREMLSGTTVYVAGSVFDLHIRACHSRGQLAFRIRLGGGSPSITYDADFALAAIGLRVADWMTGASVDRGEVDLSDVAECGS